MRMFPRRHKPILIAVTFSFIVVGFSFWFTHRDNNSVDNTVVPDSQSSTSLGDTLPGIQTTDHILGNPTAPIVFIVYSDFSCPYCKDYHKTLRTLMRLYGSEGQVAVVFRHMPFVQLHPEAPMYALASECVAQEKGNVGFWNFADILFDVADPLKPLSAAELVLLAEKVGVNRQSFVACMRSNDLMAVVEKDFNEVIDTGVRGSPFTVVDDPHGRVSFEGAQNLRTLAQAVQTIIRTQNIQELAPPSSGSFMDDFEKLDVQTATSSNTTDTADTATTTQKSKKPSSILDGIIEE